MLHCGSNDGAWHGSVREAGASGPRTTKGYSAHDDGVQGAGRGQSPDDARSERLPRRRPRVHYNLLEPALDAGRDRAGRGRARHRRRLPRLDRPAHRPQPQGQVRRPRALGRGRDLVGEQRADGAGALRRRCSPTCTRTSRAANSSSRTSTPAPTRRYRLNVRVITELAWHGLFIRHLLRRPAADGAARASLPASPSSTARASRPTPRATAAARETVIAISFEQQLILIGGTAYAGENKKAVFTVLNYLLPAQGVMPMHCSANHARGDDGRRRGVLRPVGHRQDHALGRSRTAC